MHQHEVFFPVLEERDDTVDLCDGRPRGGDDHRQRAGDRLLQQWPVGERTTRDLEDVEAILNDAVDRFLVEGCANRDEAVGPDGGDQFAGVLPGEAGLLEALDVLDVLAALVIRVDEGIQCAVLHLEREGEVEIARNRREFLDQLDAVFSVAHVVVGHFKDKKPLGDAGLTGPLGGIRFL